MHAALVVTHVTLMIASLALMPTAIMLAMHGVRASVPIATNGIVAAAAGSLFGGILLLDSFILTECILLTSYLVAMIAVYAKGFGWGVAPKARLLKQA